MPGKSLTPNQITEAVTLRAAGYTLTAISQRTGISLRTLNRHFEQHGAKKGTVKDEVIEAAKRDLIEGITSNDRVKEEAGRMVADDLAHGRLLRERMALACEHLTATNLEEAALLMRAAAAYSTAIKNTSDMMRHTLRTDRALDQADEQDLPVLVIQEISAEDALQMRRDNGKDIPPPHEGDVPLSAPEGTCGPSEEDIERVSEGEDETA